MTKRTVKDYSTCGTFFTGNYEVEFDENTPSPHEGVVTSIRPRWPNAKPNEARSMTIAVGAKVWVYDSHEEN